MDKKPKKELIDDIRDFLLDFEEPYNDKEWHSFKEYRQIKPKKTIPLYVKIAGIAASVCLLVYASVKLNTILKNNDQIELNNPSQQQLGDSAVQDALNDRKIKNLNDSLDTNELSANDSLMQLSEALANDNLSKQKKEINETIIQLQKQVADFTAASAMQNKREIKETLRNLQNQITALTTDIPEQNSKRAPQQIKKRKVNARIRNITENHQADASKSREITAAPSRFSAFYYAPIGAQEITPTALINNPTFSHNAIHWHRSLKNNLSVNKPSRTKPLKQQKTSRAKRLQFPNIQDLFDKDISIRNLRPGVNINTGFTPKGLAMGAGLSVQIPLTDHLSTEIGGSYSLIKGETNIETDNPTRIGGINREMPIYQPNVVTATSIGIGVKHRLGIVSLPISVNYLFTESFSTSLTLRPFKVLYEHGSDIAREEKWESLPSSTGYSNKLISSETREIKRSNTDYKNTKYLGFLEASTNISPPFLARYNTVIAPYLAIPIGKLKNDQYKWINGGISLKFYFTKP